MSRMLNIVQNWISQLSLPQIGITDVIEILLISFCVYQLIIWIKYTRAYALLKGTLVVMVFIFLAYIFKMNTILWIAGKLGTILITAVLVIFQPELRKALEQLGRKNILASFVAFDSSKEVSERFSDRTVSEIIRACYDMSEVKTGALIVIEKDVPLTEYERTGIVIDAVISSQLLINIFEHNTPLHDGAVIVRGNRITSATCYLPLSDNMELSKQLGTRHRAAVGISEATDSLTIIVSEETGQVSVAANGRIERNLNSVQLRRTLERLQDKTTVEGGRIQHLWRGLTKHGK